MSPCRTVRTINNDENLVYSEVKSRSNLKRTPPCLLLKVQICAEDAVERHEDLGVVGEHARLALDGERVGHLLHHRVAEELDAVAGRGIAVLIGIRHSK